MRALGGALAVALAAALMATAAPAGAAPTTAALTAPVYGQTWAGYDAVAAAPLTGMRPYFTRVTGAWSLPAARCVASVSSQASVWVGLGGVLDTAAVYGPLQVGTDSDCVNGRAVYFAWYEDYPEPLTRVRLRVEPQDALTASVSIDAAGTPLLVLSDATTGEGLRHVLRNVHVRALATDSAEWIVEGPSAPGRTLTDFGSVAFSDATATQADSQGVHTGGVDDPAWGYSEPDVLGANAAGAHQSAVESAAAPGPLSAPGSAFTVDYGSGAPSTAQ